MSAPRPPEFSPDPAQAAIDETAAHWLARRDRGLSAAEQLEFDRWLAADARHALTFAEMAGNWLALDGIEEPETETAAPFAPRSHPAPPRTRRVLPWALAGTVAAGIALGFGFWLQTPRPTPGSVTGAAATQFSTGLGEQRRIPLPDGSTVMLNTDSSLELAFGPGERRVVLGRGEALFTVAKDAARPFVVLAGTAQIRAVGTEFSVLRRDGETEVLVTEGRVAVGPAGGETRGARQAVDAGFHVRLTAQGAIAGTVPLDVAERNRRLAWREGRLEFHETPLAQVVAEFNRHNARRLVVADAATGAIAVDGIFRATDEEALLAALATAFGITMEKREDGAIWLRRTRER